MEKLSSLLAFCEGNPPLTGGFRSQRPVTRSFDVFFGLRLNKQSSKQSTHRWFDTPLRSLWRHCNVLIRLSEKSSHANHGTILRYFVHIFGHVLPSNNHHSIPDDGKCMIWIHKNWHDRNNKAQQKYVHNVCIIGGRSCNPYLSLEHVSISIYQLCCRDIMILQIDSCYIHFYKKNNARWLFNFFYLSWFNFYFYILFFFIIIIIFLWGEGGYNNITCVKTSQITSNSLTVVMFTLTKITLIFHTTGPLWREPVSGRWVPLIKGLWCVRMPSRHHAMGGRSIFRKHSNYALNGAIVWVSIMTKMATWQLADRRFFLYQKKL